MSQETKQHIKELWNGESLVSFFLQVNPVLTNLTYKMLCPRAKSFELTLLLRFLPHPDRWRLAPVLKAHWSFFTQPHERAQWNLSPPQFLGATNDEEKTEIHIYTSPVVLCYLLQKMDFPNRVKKIHHYILLCLFSKNWRNLSEPCGASEINQFNHRLYVLFSKSHLFKYLCSRTSFGRGPRMQFHCASSLSMENLPLWKLPSQRLSESFRPSQSQLSPSSSSSAFYNSDHSPNTFPQW